MTMAQLRPLLKNKDENAIPRDRHAWLLIWAISAQLFLLWMAMPLSAIASAGWFFHIDNPFHVYQLEQARALQEQARWTGYDPYFGAGSFGGLSSNLSARLTLLFAAVLPTSVSTNNVYAVYVLMCSLAAPASLWVMGVMLEWSVPQKALALIVGLLMWWIGVFHWYHTAGMVSFVAACYLALPYGVWAVQVCNPDTRFNAARLLAVGVAGAVGMWLHPLFCVTVVFIVLGFIFQLHAYRRPGALLIRAVTIGSVVIVLCLPWVYALVVNGPAVSDAEGYQRAVGIRVLFDSLGLGTGAAIGSWLNIILLVGALAGLVIRHAGRESKAEPLLAIGVSLLVFASFSGLSGTLAAVQPNRFIGPAYLIIGLAAARDMATLAQRILLAKRFDIKFATVAGAVLLVFAIGRELIREVTPGQHGHHGKSPPEITGPPEIVSKLESWINTHTDTDGRILFETSLGRVHGGGHVAGYLAARTKREFMGGAYPYFLPATSCWDQHCFDRPIADVSPEFLRKALSAYNSHWIIAHSRELKQLAEKTADVRMVAQFDGITIYAYDAAKSYILQGQGQVTARTFNRIEVQGASGPEVVLKYHWVHGLETDPPSQVEPFIWSPAFPPFVRIVSPPASFVLQLAK